MITTEKLALVTGASRGIGQAIAKAFGEQNIYVVGTATSQAGADNIDAYFDKCHIKGKGVVLDITSQESIDAVLKMIEETYNTHVSILVNNAGKTQDNILVRMKTEEWDQVIDTNLNGVFRLTKSCIRSMIKARWGRIISISSVSGIMGNPGQCNYSASKAAIIGFSKSLALEIASRNITVNVVAPGFVQTDMVNMFDDNQKQQLAKQIPIGRFAKPEEISAAVLFLASSGADYITGETININGGMHMV